jgi:thiol-disulfide isomerase/thioredoxin
MFKAIFFVLMLSLSSINAVAEEKQTLFSSPQQNQQTVELFFFWSHFCPHCLEAKPYVENLAQRYSWLKLHSHDLINNQENVNLYVSMANQLHVTPNAVPAFIFCGQIQVGFSSGLELEKKLLDCHESKQTQAKQSLAEEVIDIPVLGNIHYQQFSLPVFTLIIAALDAFNPCAFFVLCFLLSLIVHSRDRVRIAVIGGTFVLFSGLMYFFFMAAWLNLFLYTRQVAFITALAGIIAILAGVINIKDYFFFQKGVSLSIPESAKPKLFQRMRMIAQTAQWPLMLAATAILAIAANSYELLCTAGFPMVYTRILTLNALSTQQYYLYLALYNVIYVVPLLLIVTVFTYTLGNKKLSEREGRVLKLLSGNMMLGLGLLLFFAPQLLNNMLASVLIMLIAVAITVVLAL